MEHSTAHNSRPDTASGQAQHSFCKDIHQKHEVGPCRATKNRREQVQKKGKKAVLCAMAHVLCTMQFSLSYNELIVNCLQEQDHVLWRMCTMQFSLSYNELIVNCLQEQDRIISHKAYASSEDIYRFIDQLGNSNTYPYMV